MSLNPSGDARPRGGWPLGLVGMLALIVLVETRIAHRFVEFGTMTTIEWRMSGKAVKKQAPQAEILCFGTSLTRLGVSPLILAEKTGLSAYSFALSGGQSFATYTMLRHALEAGAKPKAIVFDTKWTAIANDPKGLERILPEIGSFGECAEMARAIGDPDFLARIEMTKLLPSYRCRHEIRANVMAAVDGRTPDQNTSWAITARNMKVNRGAMHTPGGPQNPAGDSNFYPAGGWACNPVNEAYLDKFLALAEAHAIPVFWLQPPVPPAVAAKLEATGVDASYTRFVESVAARHPGVRVVDARRSHYPDPAFFDNSHLNRYGAANLSADLGATIREILADSPAADRRWVALPAYSGGAGGDRLEDYLGSHATMLAEKKANDDSRVVR